MISFSSHRTIGVHMEKKAVFLIKRDPFQGLEWQSLVTVMRRLIQECDGGGTELHVIDKADELTICGMLEQEGCEIFVFVYGNVLIAGEGVDQLARTALQRHDLSVIVPVANLSRISQQFQAPPFFYQTIPAFRWVSQEIYSEFLDEVAETDKIDDFCFAVRRDFLKGLTGDVRLAEFPEMIGQRGGPFGIAKGAFAHRYGDLYESPREDLLSLVPLDARDILDIGCARGCLGEILKRRQTCRVTGVDEDATLLEVAQQRLDRVIAGDIEKLIDGSITGQFDCIVCGDILEHLNNPWRSVRGLRQYLKSGGRVVASVPNVANWAILYEMLKGRWDYVPFTILSGTHIRFFTKDTLRECFEDAGYRVTDLYFQSLPLPPKAVEFIGTLKGSLTDINEEALKASEIVIVATRE